MKKVITNLLILAIMYSPLKGLIGNSYETFSQRFSTNELFLDSKIEGDTISSKNKLEGIVLDSTNQIFEEQIAYNGGMKITFVDKDTTIKIPTWKQLGVKKGDMCSQYARKLAFKLGYNLTKSDETWNLHKYNPWVQFSEDSLSRGDFITFYNPKSKYNRKGRKETHTAIYLGKDEEGEDYFAEQRGTQTKISTLEELRKDGIFVGHNLAKSALKAQMEIADKMQTSYTLILGQREVQDSTIIIRDMESGIQEIIDQKKLKVRLKKILSQLM